MSKAALNATVSLMDKPLFQQVVNCHTRDKMGLSDLQKSPEKSQIAIDRVGIERFRLPLLLQSQDGSIRGHDGEASMFVYLEKEKTGVNMSRFCSIIQEETETHPLTIPLIKKILSRFRTELRDFDHEHPLLKSFLTLDFHYPWKQPSLLSQNWGWQYYEVQYEAQNIEDHFELFLQIKYEYSSTCPCSLALSKQYEKDYREGKTPKGHGVANAHSQRSIATVKIKGELPIEELLKLLRKAIPTETQSLVKRQDEQAFALLNGENPLFVEHAARNISLVLDDEPLIQDWQAKVEHLESLHSHNAVAMIGKKLSSPFPL